MLNATLMELIQKKHKPNNIPFNDEGVRIVNFQELYSLYNNIFFYIQTPLSKYLLTEAKGFVFGYSVPTLERIECYKVSCISYLLFVNSLAFKNKKLILNDIVSFCMNSNNHEYLIDMGTYLECILTSNSKDGKHIVDCCNDILEYLHEYFKSKEELTFDNQIYNMCYIYENFMYQYYKDDKDVNGAVYTPPSVCNFIIRSLNQVVEKHFPDKNAKLMDYAIGTGIFMINFIKKIISGEFNLNKYKKMIAIELDSNSFFICILLLTLYKNLYDLDIKLILFNCDTLKIEDIEDDKLIMRASLAKNEKKDNKKNLATLF